MNKFTCIALVMSCFTSCKIITVQQENQTKTTQNLQLGAVGVQRNVLWRSDYNPTAFPDYEDPIKLKVSLVPFNSIKHKAFTKSKQTQDQSVQATYIDTIKPKPWFIKLEIADRVTLINSLNSKENTGVFNFLKQQNRAHIVSAISVVFSTEVMAHLSSVQEVYLEQLGLHNYVIKTYNNDLEQQTILFNKGVVFGYQPSRVCWKKQAENKFIIGDLVERNSRCPSTTTKRIKETKKPINNYIF